MDNSMRKLNLMDEWRELEEDDSFQKVFYRHYEPLCRFAYLFLHDKAVVEEVVDDVLFNLWEHRKTIEIAYSLRAYLMRAVRNRCLNELNSRTYREELSFTSFSLPENVEFLDSVFDDTLNPLGRLLRDELEDKLEEEIAALPEQCRAVFQKSRYEEKTYEEIAQEMGISVNTVKYHIKNALALLHNRLSDYLKLILLYIFSGS